MEFAFLPNSQYEHKKGIISLRQKYSLFIVFNWFGVDIIMLFSAFVNKKSIEAVCVLAKPLSKRYNVENTRLRRKYGI